MPSALFYRELRLLHPLHLTFYFKDSLHATYQSIYTVNWSLWNLCFLSCQCHFGMEIWKHKITLKVVVEFSFYHVDITDSSFQNFLIPRKVTKNELFVFLEISDKKFKNLFFQKLSTFQLPYFAQKAVWGYNVWERFQNHIEHVPDRYNPLDWYCS